jgi:TnpA family transposase
MNKKIDLSPEMLDLIKSKQNYETQVVFSVLLIFFKQFGRFPRTGDKYCIDLIPKVCSHLHLEELDHFNILEKTINSSLKTVKRFRDEIRIFLQFKVFNKPAHLNELIDYCKINIFPLSPKWDQVIEQAYAYLKNQKIEPCTKIQLDCFLTTAHHQFEAELFKKIEGSLTPEIKKDLDRLVKDDKLDKAEVVELHTKSEKIVSAMQPMRKPLRLGHLKEEKAHLKIDSILYEIQKYKELNAINVPKTIESFGSRKLFEKYHERVLVESPSHIRDHKETIRYAYLSIFCIIQQQRMTDTLTDLLLKLLQRILSRAERSVDRALQLDNKRVKGKMGTLLALARKSIDHPDGVIKETIYPEISKDRLTEIVVDLGEDGQWYRNQVKAKALSLYSHNNRRIIWTLINALEFGSEPQVVKVLKAINFLKEMNADETGEKIISLKQRLYNPILLKNIIADNWLPFVTIKTNHLTKIRINWCAFELALFERLETELSVKNIWVKQAFRYRNPNEDMPSDFDENEDYYFNLLGLPKNVEEFIESLQQTVDEQLHELNRSILTNPKVVIKDRKKRGAIKITPFDPQHEPQNLEFLKLEIAKLWPNLDLIDILKEADFRIGFTKCLESAATRESINEETLTKRLLLCVFGLGSNTGLKRMSGLGKNQESYDSLRYVKRRFINCQNVRFSIQKVVNAINLIRDPLIWGNGTTSCAADSKKIAVWDQNLLVEWHARYGGRGVMIYWHVDKKGLCIHSMIKSCTSSEVGAMIHGVLHHDTLMDISEISVDTHGQSCIGFAFSELFRVDLLPRLKNINKQKLYCSSRRKKDEYPNLTDALASDPIQWNKIRPYYREVVRHAVALKMRTVEPDVLMRRLSADNKSNPVYQALMEIGKASRTIFLCRYLNFEELRIDINDALNVVERVNGIMGFIFYGRLGEISTNNTNDQELSLLCLHLLQVCMVYINTILIQTALSDPKWMVILKAEDMRALSPLFHLHINPYGLLFLDMNKRINIEAHRYKEKIA